MSTVKMSNGIACPASFNLIYNLLQYDYNSIPLSAFSSMVIVMMCTFCLCQISNLSNLHEIKYKLHTTSVPNTPKRIMLQFLKTMFGKDVVLVKTAPIKTAATAQKSQKAVSR